MKRLRYVIENGVKEQLVHRPDEWPGASGLETLLTGKPQAGTWYDRTSEYNARRRKGGDILDSTEFSTEYQVQLAPLPCWSHLSPEERRTRVGQLVHEIESDAAERLRDGATVLGREAILAQEPTQRPRELKRSPGPRCHATRTAVRNWYRKLLEYFIAAYRDASKAFRAGEHDVQFPEGCFRPGGSFVPRAAGSLAA